ncbi:TPA: replication initiation protein [Klebsiella pneumoniae]
MNEVAKYKNELNVVSMRKWTKEEMDFFFAILAKVKYQGTKDLVFERYELECMVHSDANLANRKTTLKRLVDHVGTLRYIEETPRSYETMALFRRFRVEWNDNFSDYRVLVKVSEEFQYILNKIEDNFTRFPIEEFVQLKSTYSKTLYRQLKQYRTTGWREFSLDEFKRLLDIPKSYPTNNIDKRVLAPCLKELPQFFPNLRLKKIHADKRGRPLIGLKFTWTPEESDGWNPNKYQNKVIKSGQKSKNKINPKLPDWYGNKPNTPPTAKTKKELEKRLERLKKGVKVETEEGEMVEQGILFDE